MQQNNKETILICDDNPGWRSTMAAILAKDFTVVTTSSKQAAIQILQALDISYTVLITDIRLDDLDLNNEDGLRLVEFVKKSYPRLGTIVVTGYGTDRISIKALDLEVDDYIQKVEIDIDVQIFRKRVWHVVNKYQNIRINNSITLLHLSDLHFSEAVDPLQLLQPLIMDIRDKEEGVGFDYLNYLVISGDMTNRAKPAEFEKAREFVAGLMQEFKLSPTQCIFVPGNHDLSWEEEIYKWRREQSVDIKKLRAGTWVKEGKGYLVRETRRYPHRFKNFVDHFFYPLMQRSYPLTFDEQFSTLFDAENKIQFLALNSCCEIDEHFPHRSSIHMGALTRGLQQAQTEVKTAIANQQIENEAEILRIAVWHHPVTGNEKIEEDAFLEQLQRARFKLCLHGHVHEDRTDLIGYMHPTRKIHIAGAGSFGAPANSRPESTPRLYNLLEISPDRSQVKVHTRRLRRGPGAWEGYAEWRQEGGAKNIRVPFYIVPLGEPASAKIAPKADSSSGGTVIHTGGGSISQATYTRMAAILLEGIRVVDKLLD